MIKHLMLVLVLWIGSIIADAQTLPRFEPEDCPFHGTYDDISCGDLIVPENRQAPSPREIRLAVAILHSTAADPQPDPVIYLVGGPGASIVRAAPTLRNDFGSMLAERDIILIDQRGTGHSTPLLTCPEEDEATISSIMDRLTVDETAQRHLDAVTACHDRLIAEGIDLNAYNTTESAADIAALIEALDYEQANLFGVSYGTRLALTVMRDFPNRVRSAVLDSAVPVEAISAFGTDVMPDGLRRVVAECAQTVICQEAYPNLKADLLGLLRQLETDPLLVNIYSLTAQQSITVPVDGKMLASVIFGMMYAPGVGGISEIPALLHEIQQGETARLVENLQLQASPTAFASGMTYSVWCHEDYVQTTRDAYRAGIDAEPDFAFLLKIGDDYDELPFDRCEIWDVAPATPEELAPVVSDVPTLILAGVLDHVTPPRFGERVHERLTNSYLYIYPGQAHNVTSAGCPMQMATAFLNDPTVAPDASCMAQMSALRFVLPADFVAVAQQREAEPITLRDTPLSSDWVVGVPEHWTEVDRAYTNGVAVLELLSLPEDDISSAIAMFAEDRSWRQPRERATHDLAETIWTEYAILSGDGFARVLATADASGTTAIVMHAPGADLPEALFDAIMASIRQAD